MRSPGLHALALGHCAQGAKPTGCLRRSAHTGPPCVSPRAYRVVGAGRSAQHGVIGRHQCSPAWQARRLPMDTTAVDHRLGVWAAQHAHIRDRREHTRLRREKQPRTRLTQVGGFLPGERLPRCRSGSPVRPLNARPHLTARHVHGHRRRIETRSPEAEGQVRCREARPRPPARRVTGSSAFATTAAAAAATPMFGGASSWFTRRCSELRSRPPELLCCS